MLLSTRRFVTGLCALTLTAGAGAAATAAPLQPAASVCENGSPRCVQTTIKNMQRRFNPLAAACSHQAIFSLAYLRTTEKYAEVAARPNYFIDVAFVNQEDAVFAQYYFRAYDNWAAHRLSRVPESWRIAFDAAKNRQVSGSGNLLLGMSAHVNRDLPFVLAELGLGLKADHDKVNHFLAEVAQPLLAELTARFDDTMDDAEDGYGLTRGAFLELLFRWRELAWQHANQLVDAPTPAARALVAKEIESSAAATARSLLETFRYKPGASGAKERDAYCATHG